jgi:hypothetical protein
MERKRIITLVAAVLVVIAGQANGQGGMSRNAVFTIEGPERVEGEPGAQVEVNLDYYLTGATHTVRSL